MKRENGSHWIGREYTLHGLTIASEVPLGPYESDIRRNGSDIEILLRSSYVIPGSAPAGTLIASVAHRSLPGTAFCTATADGAGYLLRIHGVCDLRISPEMDQIACHLDPASDVDEVAVHLCGTALAFVLGLRDELVVHASAVSLPKLGGDVVAIAGGTGVGKSTITALLCAAGCPFVSDDLIRLAFDSNGAVSLGSCPELRLRPGAQHILDAFGRDRPQVRATVDGRLAVRLGSGDTTTRRVRAIVVPQPDRRLDQVRTERLAAGDALVLLGRYPRLEGWISPAVLRMQFAALARLVASTPVFLARIPWSPGPDVMSARALVENLVQSA